MKTTQYSLRLIVRFTHRALCSSTRKLIGSEFILQAYVRKAGWVLETRNPLRRNQTGRPLSWSPRPSSLVVSPEVPLAIGSPSFHSIRHHLWRAFYIPHTEKGFLWWQPSVVATGLEAWRAPVLELSLKLLVEGLKWSGPERVFWIFGGHRKPCRLRPPRPPLQM